MIEGIKKGVAEGKKEKKIAEELGISVSYVHLLKSKAKLTKPGSEIRDWAENDRWLSDWIDECRADRTKYGYAFVMRKYCDFRGKTPEELLREAEEDNKKSFLDKNLKHELVGFRKKLRNDGVSETTIKNYMAALQSFFKFYNVLLPELKNGRAKSDNRKSEYDREKVKKLIGVCTPREQAIFLTMFQTGLASNEISKLRIKDLGEVEENITILRLQRQKSGEFFTTFIGCDGRRAIDEYLRLRNEGHLMPTRPDISEKAKVKGEDDYVFVTWDATKGKWGKVTPNHISRYMLQACRKLGWKIKSESIKQYNPNRPHALRASFSNILINEGRVPKFFCDHMLGHALNDVDKAYFEAHKNELFQYYKEAEHLLSISEIDRVPDTKYEELVIELHKRNGKIRKLEGMVETLGEKIAANEAEERDRAVFTEEEIKLVKDLLKNPLIISELAKKEPIDK